MRSRSWLASLRKAANRYAARELVEIERTGKMPDLLGKDEWRCWQCGKKFVSETMPTICPECKAAGKDENPF